MKTKFLWALPLILVAAGALSAEEAGTCSVRPETELEAATAEPWAETLSPGEIRQVSTVCSAESTCYFPSPNKVYCKCQSGGQCTSTGDNGTVTCDCDDGSYTQNTCGPPSCDDDPVWCTSEQAYLPCPSGTVHCIGWARGIDCYDQAGNVDRRHCSDCGTLYMCIE